MNQTHHMKPIAAGLASLGRGGDSMLVHMQPREVAGLQRLAMSHGGSLTLNPETGLPEAGFLGDVLGAVAPIALGAWLGPAGAGLGGGFFESALGAGITTGLLTYAVTGDPLKGLMGGLGGAGGANLGSAIQSAAPSVASVTPVAGLGESAATAATAGQGAASTLPAGSTEFWNAGRAATAATPQIPYGAQTLWDSGIDISANPAMAAAPSAASPMEAAWGIGRTNPTLAQGWEAVKADPWAFIKENKSAALTAASPLLAAATTVEPYKMPSMEEDTGDYTGPYLPTERQVSFPTAEERQQLGSKEWQYFNPVQPYPGYYSAPYAAGGSVFGTADQGSDPGQDAIEARTEYGLGGLANFAEGGSTAEKNYGITAVSSVPSTAGAVPTSSTYANSYSVPSVAFQQQLDARQKQLDKLMGVGTGFMGPMISYAGRNKDDYEGGYSGPRGLGVLEAPFGNRNFGLTRAQAEARLGPAPVWNPAAMGVAGAAPTAVPGPMSAYQGTGITTMPTAVPRPSVLGDYTAAVSNAIGMPHLAKGGYLDGAGDGMSDSIPATIEGRQPARLADGEFVIPADVVSHLGNGSTKAGAHRLYNMMNKVRKARTGTTKQGKQIKPEKYMPA